MKKIPTVFRRDPDDMAHVLPEVNPGCEWVLAGEGVATRKYDGTCVMRDEDGDWWARREVKRAKPRPEGFVAIEADPNTGKTVGWEPVAASPFAKFHAEALVEDLAIGRHFEPGTYELCGPKVQGNPEGYERHRLVKHPTETVRLFDFEPDFVDFQFVIGDLLKREGWEGVVWHHPDGRMAKLKARDFKVQR